MLSYLCAYFRHYYKHEFITAYLNNPGNPDDVIDGTKLAQEYGIRVTPPRWGISKEHFVFSKEDDLITKGLESIKYFNKKVGNELFKLAAENKYESFMDLLVALKKTSIDSRQLDILIKIGFFNQFGNCNELMRIWDMFKMFKEGDAKKIKSDSVSPELLSVVSKFATNKNAKGEELKSYTIEDMHGLLSEIETEIKSKHLPELPLKTLIQNSLDCLGYVDVTTGKPEDRRKLVVEEYQELFGKENGKRWCARVNVVSIGTGKKSRLTIRDKTLNKTPISSGDIIYADDLFKNKAGYWELSRYHKIY